MLARVSVSLKAPGRSWALLGRARCRAPGRWALSALSVLPGVKPSSSGSAGPLLGRACSWDTATALSDTPLSAPNALVSVLIGHGVKLSVALTGHGV
ncbi:hypothetical protein AVU96_gp054 [Mycobacterium phage Snenia]|uniref:hypothetical protein n=1 Tax=Mycobacterium phage Snenia TaxID=1698714 RepID=UPI0006CE41AD|nr:hypothetical protein AVU96_gp054 [Mycobacterium phage Snenia]ALF01581.1 hypothetical protein SNENIA_135 [Mycobacterium phage Snenia]